MLGHGIDDETVPPLLRRARLAIDSRPRKPRVNSRQKAARKSNKVLQAAMEIVRFRGPFQG